MLAELDRGRGMKMGIRSVGLALAALLVPWLPSRAQSHLEPLPGILNRQQWELGYAQRLRDVLLKDASMYHVARMVCQPSFRPEWVVSVVRKEDKDPDAPPSYEVELVQSDRPLFPPEKSKGAKAKRWRAVLDREAAESLNKTWRAMLRTTRYPDEMGGGKDGVTYEFSRFVPRSESGPDDPPGGWEEGQTWSPDEDSPCGLLVAVGESLKSYTMARPEDRPKHRSELRDRLARLDGMLAGAGSKR
jgi:hypothetical protein